MNSDEATAHGEPSWPCVELLQF